MKAPTKNDRGFKGSTEKLQLLLSSVSANSQNFLRGAGQTQHWKLLGDYKAVGCPYNPPDLGTL